jgi:hypothetical protein
LTESAITPANYLVLAKETKMNDDQIREICKIRLGQWTEVLVEKHCTPAILIGVGHDEASGAIHIVIPENWSEDQAVAILTSTLATMNKKDNRHLRN